ncbi:MarR family winged helix-turn-helix transcriptional regulator [Clostridium pasteurianum]|uniref:Transcriptional regulator n=1 Tax=Clostridium pasteurianum BC1 TaxID=86416 RepID=R4K9R4_CLOPA|nr:MarR family transcriptional regulator [Clostridium pasteurianum]AGK98426.1 transcriptional regulator [Clostridium pasteurianum BC1]
MENSLAEVVDKLLLLLPTLEKRLIRPLELEIKPSLSILQYNALFIMKNDEILTMSELSNKMCISKQQLTPMVDKLIDNELVERMTNEKDRRIINVRLSERGYNFLNDSKAEITEALKKRMEVFDQDEVNTLLKAIDDIYSITKKLG